MTPVEDPKPKITKKVFIHLYTKKMVALGGQKPKFMVGTKVRLALTRSIQLDKSWLRDLLHI